MKTRTWFILVIICALVLGAVGYYTKFQSDQNEDLLTYTNTTYKFELRLPSNYSISQRSGDQDLCDTKFDEIVIRDSQTNRDLLVANNGVGCVGGFPTKQVGAKNLTSGVIKNIALDTQNDTDSSNDKRFVTYTFGEFTSMPVYDKQLESSFDRVFATYTTIK